MALNDTLANTFAKMLNAENAKKTEVLVGPRSLFAMKVLSILQGLRYIGDVTPLENGKGGLIKINLLGNINKCGVIKPRFSIKKDGYKKYEKRFLPAKDFGVLIVSTSQGLMTHQEAKEKNTGGKLVAYCY